MAVTTGDKEKDMAPKAPEPPKEPAAPKVKETKADDPVALARAQQKLASQIRGEDTAAAAKAADLDRQYRENWVRQQRAAYPELYRVADARLASGGEPMARPGTPLALGPVALEPGHDASLDYEKDAAVYAVGAGGDNRPPSAATNTLIIRDPSVI